MLEAATLILGLERGSENQEKGDQTRLKSEGEMLNAER